jgi:hypothetical protein
MIVDVGDETIDFSKVTRVGSIGGDSSFRRYTVYFDGGNVMEVFESNRHPCMKRSDFINTWKASPKK